MATLDLSQESITHNMLVNNENYGGPEVPKL